MALVCASMCMLKVPDEWLEKPRKARVLMTAITKDKRLSSFEDQKKVLLKADKEILRQDPTSKLELLALSQSETLLCAALEADLLKTFPAKDACRPFAVVISEVTAMKETALYLATNEAGQGAVATALSVLQNMQHGISPRADGNSDFYTKLLAKCAHFYEEQTEGMAADVKKLTGKEALEKDLGAFATAQRTAAPLATAKTEKLHPFAWLLSADELDQVAEGGRDLEELKFENRNNRNHY